MFTPSRIAAATIAVVIIALVIYMAIPRETEDPAPTPTATARPTATVGPTATVLPPTPTPTPRPPTPAEALSAVRAASADLDAYGFTFTRHEANIPQISATGTWLATGNHLAAPAYDVSVSLPVCPPAVPGAPGDVPDAPAPEESDCLLLHAFREIKNGSVSHSISPDRTVGEWALGSNLIPYGLAFLNHGISPIDRLLTTIELTPQAQVFEVAIDGIPVYQLIVPLENGETLWIHIGRDSSLLHLIIITGEPGTTRGWKFTRHDEPLAVAQPLVSDISDPIDWFSRKTIRLVEDDPRIASEPLRPFLAPDEPIVAALVDALTGSTPSPRVGTSLTGRFLTIHFTDGSRFAIGKTIHDATAQIVLDHFTLHSATPIVVRSEALAGWWGQLDSHFKTINPVTWPGRAVLDEPLRLSGQGWPDQTVVLSTTIDGKAIEFAEAQTTQGAWEWEGDLPEGIQPGAREFTASNANPGDFAHDAKIFTIAIEPPPAFAIDDRPIRVVYTTSTPSALPDGGPLWVGIPEHHDAILDLVSAIKGAATLPTLDREVDRTNALHINHLDGTATLIHFAGDCGSFTETTVCTDNRWIISHVDEAGARIGAVTTIDSPDLSLWWQQRESFMPPYEPVRVPDSVGQSDRITVRGQGWPTGGQVTVSISSVLNSTGDRTELFTGQANLYYGGFSIQVEHRAPLQGILEITVTGAGTGTGTSSVLRLTTYS
jgi:hypothetical protein